MGENRVILTWETHLKPQYNPKLREYSILGPDKLNGQGGGVALLFTNECQTTNNNSFLANNLEYMYAETVSRKKHSH